VAWDDHEASEGTGLLSGHAPARRSEGEATLPSQVAGRGWRPDALVQDEGRSRSVSSQLQAAIAEGLPFDLGTGLPVRWETSADTWWSWSQQWLLLKWPQWSGNSRRSAVESLVSLTPHLLRPGAPPPPPGLPDWLRNSGFQVPKPKEDRNTQEQWLQRWSARLAELDPNTIETTLTAATTKLDGTVMSPEVVRRRRNTLNSVLRGQATQTARRRHSPRGPSSSRRPLTERALLLPHLLDAAVA
jgi:hypothetical protein